MGQSSGAGAGPSPHAGIHGGHPLQEPEDTAVTLERVPAEVPGARGRGGAATWLPPPWRPCSPPPPQARVRDGALRRNHCRHTSLCPPEVAFPFPLKQPPAPLAHPAPLSLTRELGSPGLGTGIWGGSRDYYWPGSWWKERRRRSRHQRPGSPVSLGDGVWGWGAVRAGW